MLPTQTAIAAEAAAFVEEDPGQRDHLADLRAGSRTGYPIVNYEYAIVNDPPDRLEQRPRTSVRFSSGPSTRRTATAPTYLTQVNFQPLPAKVVTQSLKQITTIQ